MKAKKQTVLVATTIASFLVCALSPVNAEAWDEKWMVRISALSMNPAGDSVVADGNGEWARYTADAEFGFGIDFEYRTSRRVGIDFGVLSAAPVLDVVYDEAPVISATAKPRITPVYLGLNIHLTPDSRFDFFIGPLLAYVVYSGFDLVVDPAFLTEEGFVSENDLGVGVNLGLDVRLGDGGWLLTAAFKYLDTTLEASPPEEGTGWTAIDPKIFSIGVGYWF